MRVIRAEVIALRQGRMTLRLLNAPGGGCGRCHEPGGCGAVQLPQLFAFQPRLLSFPAIEGAQAGSRVELQISQKALLWSALLSYGLGIALMLLFAGAGHWYAGDCGAFVGTLVALLVVLAVHRWLPAVRWWRYQLHITLIPLIDSCHASSR